MKRAGLLEQTDQPDRRRSFTLDLQFLPLDVKLLNPGIVRKNTGQFLQRNDDGGKHLPFFQQVVMFIDFGFQITPQGVSGFCGRFAFFEPRQQLHHGFALDQQRHGHGGQRQHHHQPDQPRIETLEHHGWRLALLNRKHVDQLSGKQSFLCDYCAHRGTPVVERFY